MAPTVAIRQEVQPQSAASSLLAFAKYRLGLTLYDWQKDAISPFDDIAWKLTQVSLATPNESGKSSVVIPTVVLGILTAYPQARVVLTTADSKQLDNQVMPAIHRHRGKFMPWKFNEREITTPTGGRFVAWTTDDPGRAEGWQPVSDLDGPLVIICDEAKSIPDTIFDALDRCGYSGLLLTSSPGRMGGVFYESQFNTKLDFIRLKVGLKDCPHIDQAKIDRIIAKHGASSPFARSALHGEFLESWDGKPVYYAYNQDIHEGEDLPWPMGAYLAIGSDVGTHAATTWSAYWKENGIEYWHVLYEFYADGFDADRHAREIIRITENEFPFHNDRGVCSGVLHYVDPAAANSSYTRQINVDGKDVKESALNIFRTYGIYPGFTTTGRGLQETIAIVNRLMDARDPAGNPTFRVDSKSCPRLARGFRGGYRWPEGTEKTEQNLPLKGIACDHLDHVQDGFRYSVINTLRLTKTNTARTEPATPWNMSKPKPANMKRRI